MAISNICIHTENLQHIFVTHVIIYHSGNVVMWKQCQYCSEQGKSKHLDHLPSEQELKRIL